MDITEVKDGSALKVGDKTYIFAVGKDSTVKASGANQVVVDMKNWTGKEADFVDNALKKLTETAEADGNAMFSVAYQGNGRLTFTEQETYQATAGGNAVDLSTRDAIAKQFGYAVDGLKTGGTLNLQIGDTSDKFNQMDVSVGDMHTSAMGTKGGQSIADIDIGTQAGAAEAVDVIKNAINYVSSVRGTLGAPRQQPERDGGEHPGRRELHPRHRHCRGDDGLHQEQHSGSVRPGHAGPGEPGAPGRAPAAGLIASRLKRRCIRIARWPGISPAPRI